MSARDREREIETLRRLLASDPAAGESPAVPIAFRTRLPLSSARASCTAPR